MSTLHVENLKGLSSGGNANKIIVPSGQTVDASAGTLVPSAGQVVKTETFNNNVALVTTSTSYQDVLDFNFTPTYANSFLLVSGTIGGVAYQSTSNYKGSRWRYLITPSGGSSTEELLLNYMWHVPTGEYYGGQVSFNIKYNVSSTVSHSIKIQAYARSGYSNAIRSRNGELSRMTVQEIKQ